MSQRRVQLSGSFHSELHQHNQHRVVGFRQRHARLKAKPARFLRPRRLRLLDSHISVWWRCLACLQPPSRGRPPLSRGQAKGAKAHPARPAGAPHTSRNEMCACGGRLPPRRKGQPDFRFSLNGSRSTACSPGRPERRIGYCSRPLVSDVDDRQMSNNRVYRSRA